MTLPAPHGDCVEVDEEMNRELNYFSDRFSYSYGVCKETVKQALNTRYGGVYNECSGHLLPCNPHNVTTLFGKPINDIEIASFDELLALEDSLPLQCPRRCTVQSYAVKHVVMANPYG